LYSGRPRYFSGRAGNSCLSCVGAESYGNRLPLSLRGDFIASAVVSIVADLCLNFFFVPPIFSFRVSDSSDIWALIAFLITGLVITRLMTQVRQEAMTSELQRREMMFLYDLAQRLLALHPDDAVLAKAAALFREVFRMRAVCLYDGANAELHIDGVSQNDLAERTRAAYLSHQDSDDEVTAVFIRCLHVTGKGAPVTHTKILRTLWGQSTARNSNTCAPTSERSARKSKMMPRARSIS